MTALAIVAAALVVVVVFLLGVRDVVAVSAYRRMLAEALTVETDLVDPGGLVRWDRVFRRTRPGRWLEAQLVLAGVDRPPLAVAALTTGGTLAAAWLVWTLLAPALAVVALLLGAVGLRAYLRRMRDRRRESFIVQMPELARVLSNATSAGLSISTAIGTAADELSEPAATEMRRVSTSLRFGANLEEALDAIAARLPSREVRVLVSTLVVSSRSGGSLVTALREIADTLDQRKEVRREIRTTLAQALTTGYLVIVMGVGLLVMLNVLQPGTVQQMTTSVAGQAALVVGLSLFAGGFLVIRRMTRIEP